MVDFFQEISGTIMRNKLRTFLTGFSVAWGIFILIVLLGAGNGIINAFASQSEGMKMNVMKVYPGQTTKAYQGLKEGRKIRLDNVDLEITQGFTNHVAGVSAFLRQDRISLKHGSDVVNTSLIGVMPNYIENESVYIKGGRFINEQDMKEQRKVIVLHEKTVEMLFGDKEKNVIGEYIDASGINYKIVGIYRDKGSFTPAVYVPYSTLRLVYNKRDQLGSIVLVTKGLASIERNDQFEKEYREAIALHQQFDPTDKSGIWIWNRLKQQIQQENGMEILTNSIWVIGLLTLLSGIVGVGNIMLITVKERTREFGILKALGAKPFAILKLIMVESIVITTLFGYIGLVAGIAVTEYLNVVVGSHIVDLGVASITVFKNPTVDLSIALQATLTLILAGTIAGFFPARKAVMVRPIEALRADS
ncbi:MAG: ABC transporter permease [Phocaeicola sp.]